MSHLIAAPPNCIHAAFSIELQNPPILAYWEEWLGIKNYRRRLNATVKMLDLRDKEEERLNKLVKMATRTHIIEDGKRFNSFLKGYYPVSYSHSVQCMLKHQSTDRRLLESSYLLDTNLH